MKAQFTGYHMTGILVGFFAIVVAVNVTMARYAISTFGGTVVDNSYVASQQFNGWLKAARAQAAQSWQAKLTLGPDRHPRLALTGAQGAQATGYAEHPLGRAADIPLRFTSDGAGHLRADQPLPAGRWRVHATVTRGADTQQLLDDLQ